MAPAAAAGNAVRQAAANASASGIKWSAATTSRMAAGSRRTANSQAAAMAAAESRRCGSKMIVAFTLRARVCSAATKRNSALVTTMGGANRPPAATRSNTCWKVVSGPNSGTKCFGIFSRDTGHSRVPAPPHRMTGVTK